MISKTGQENLPNQQEKKKNLKSDDSLRDLYDNIKQTNIHIIEVPEGEKREKVQKTYMKK